MAEKNLETYSLVWLDANKDSDLEKRLRSVINHVESFEQIDACKEYIQTVSSNDRIILVVSGQLGKEIVPDIHSYRQISMIYIFCSDKKKHEQWANQFSKIKYVTNQIDELLSHLEKDRTQIDEPIVFNIFNPTSAHGQSTSEINGEFLHSQLLLDTLLRMKSTRNDQKELIAICRKEYANNAIELTILDEFEKDYVADRALWWYTRESFLYRLMNKALRVQNIDLLYLFRFFIRDLAEQLDYHRCSSRMKLFRGQVLAKTELDTMKNSIGQLISINSFLSTSTNRRLALSFLQSSSSTDGLEKILFEIQADPRANHRKPFADITSLSYYPGEDEVLMMLGSIFRVEKIDFDAKNHCSIIHLTLCAEQDHDLQSVYEYLHARLEPNETSLYSFGQVLRDMGQLDAAEKYMHRFLDGLTRNNQQRDVALAYHALGVIGEEKGDYDQSLQWHQKSLDLYRKILKSNDPILADVYNCLAAVYRKKNEFKKALESYEQAMKIFGNNHLKKAMCLNNIGVVYYEDKKYAKALEYYQQALTIWKENLPVNHPHFGAVYNNMGEIYRYLNQFDRALEIHQQSLKIYEKSQSSQHPDVGTTLENLGLVYEQKHDLKKAISYFEKAENIFRKNFASNHPDVIRMEKNLERVRSKIN